MEACTFEGCLTFQSQSNLFESAVQEDDDPRPIAKAVAGVNSFVSQYAALYYIYIADSSSLDLISSTNLRSDLRHAIRSSALPARFLFSEEVLDKKSRWGNRKYLVLWTSLGYNLRASFQTIKTLTGAAQ